MKVRQLNMIRWNMKSYLVQGAVCMKVVESLDHCDRMVLGISNFLLKVVWNVIVFCCFHKLGPLSGEELDLLNSIAVLNLIYSMLEVFCILVSSKHACHVR